jgi:spermidine/putrescine transport system ATP-binding protein
VNGVAYAGVEGSIPAFSIQGLSRRFGPVVAVDDLWLDIREGEFFSLLGPSGCGKTTTLRMLAGFEAPDTGVILLRGSDVTATPPNRRNVNLVFQHYELFPHMTVFGNVAYGLRLRKVREPDLSRRVRDALRIVRVEELETRGARQLSGGQQQRVALARAIVNRPAVLLLDEPLSALDVKLRKQMQLELKQIQHDLGTTFVYVTHDQEEALLLSNRVGIMNHGRLAQVGSPREVYERPADAFVADFVGSLNTFEGVVAERHGDVTLVQSRGESTESVPLWATDGSVPIGSRVVVAVRPERVEVHAGDALQADHRTSMTGRVAQTIYLGSLTQLVIETERQRRVLVERTSEPGLDALTVGTRVVVSWPPDAAFLIAVNPT